MFVPKQLLSFFLNDKNITYIKLNNDHLLRQPFTLKEKSKMKNSFKADPKFRTMDSSFLKWLISNWTQTSTLESYLLPYSGCKRELFLSRFYSRSIPWTISHFKTEECRRLLLWSWSYIGTFGRVPFYSKKEK